MSEDDLPEGHTAAAAKPHLLHRIVQRKVARSALQKSPLANPWVLTVLAVVLVVVVVMVAVTGGALMNAAAVGAPDPAPFALEDIPSDSLTVYQASADYYHLPWVVVAGIAKVATDHGRRSPYDSIARGTAPGTSTYPEVAPPIGDESSPGAGPMLIRPDAYRDERHFHVQRVDNTADWVAQHLELAANKEADSQGLERDQIEADLAAREEDGEKTWTAFWTAVINDLPLGSPSGCSSPGASIGDRIVSLWRCASDGKSLHVITADGELTGPEGLKQLAQEALEVAWLWSRWGAVPCDPEAEAAGVFPLPKTSTVDRCNAEANISEAARLVISGEEIPPSQRGKGGPGAAAQSGWARLAPALGPDGGASFAASGFPARVRATKECRDAVDRRVRALPDDGDTSKPTPFAGFAPAHPREPYNTAWAAQPLAELRTADTCGPAADTAEWQRFVLGEMGRVFSQDGTTPEPSGHRAGLQAYLSAASARPPAQLGVTSLVRRLSNPEVAISAPTPSGRTSDFSDPTGMGAEAIRWAKAYMGLTPPPTVDASSGPCSGPVSAAADVPPATREAINALQADYEGVASAKGLPWPLLAAIDYRENSNDPSRSTLSGEPIGTANPDNPGTTTTSKRQSIELAADHIKAMASSVYGVILTASSGDEDIKQALLAYNRGYIYKRAGATADQSPYVMNQADAAHTDMIWPDIAGEPLAGRREVGRFGGWTLFSRLGGSGAAGCGSLSDVDIVRIAQGEIGTSEDNPGSDCDCGAVLKYQGSTGPEDWCADFVSWVYKEAGRPFTGGLDGGWRLPGVAGLRSWLQNNGTFYERGSADPPMAGDVVIFSGDSHTGIVESVSGDRVQTIEGNSGDMVKRRDYSVNDSYIVGWGRQRPA